MSERPNRKHKNSETVVQVLAEACYLERIGKNPLNPKKPMPKHRKHWYALHGREMRRDCMGNRINNKAPF